MARGAGRLLSDERCPESRAWAGVGSSAGNKVSAVEKGAGRAGHVPKRGLGGEQRRGDRGRGGGFAPFLSGPCLEGDSRGVWRVLPGGEAGAAGVCRRGREGGEAGERQNAREIPTLVAPVAGRWQGVKEPSGCACEVAEDAKPEATLGPRIRMQ